MNVKEYNGITVKTPQPEVITEDTEGVPKELKEFASDFATGKYASKGNFEAGIEKLKN